MAKKVNSTNGTGPVKVRNDFLRVAPWGDTLPTVQLLPEVNINQFVADDDYAKTAQPDSKERLSRPTFLTFANALAEDAERVNPVLRSIYETIKNLASNDIARARMEEFNQIKPDKRKYYKVKDDPKISYKDGGIKDIWRIIKKALDEYGGKFQKIRDVARCAIEGETSEEIAALCVVMEWMKDNDYELPGGARIVEIDNRFKVATGTRYRSLKAVVAIPIEGGERPYHLAEIMVRHKGFEKDIDHVLRRGKGNRVSHQIYHLVRSFEERYAKSSWPGEIYKKYKQHWQDVVDIHDEARDNHGLHESLMYPLFRMFKSMRAAATQQNKSFKDNGLGLD